MCIYFKLNYRWQNITHHSWLTKGIYELCRDRRIIIALMLSPGFVAKHNLSFLLIVELILLIMCLLTLSVCFSIVYTLTLYDESVHWRWLLLYFRTPTYTLPNLLMYLILVINGFSLFPHTYRLSSFSATTADYHWQVHWKTHFFPKHHS